MEQRNYRGITILSATTDLKPRGLEVSVLGMPRKQGKLCRHQGALILMVLTQCAVVVLLHLASYRTSIYIADEGREVWSLNLAIDMKDTNRRG